MKIILRIIGLNPIVNIDKHHSEIQGGEGGESDSRKLLKYECKRFFVYNLYTVYNALFHGF